MSVRPAVLIFVLIGSIAGALYAGEDWDFLPFAPRTVGTTAEQLDVNDVVNSEGVPQRGYCTLQLEAPWESPTESVHSTEARVRVVFGSNDTGELSPSSGDFGSNGATTLGFTIDLQPPYDSGANPLLRVDLRQLNGTAEWGATSISLILCDAPTIDYPVDLAVENPAARGPATVPSGEVRWSRIEHTGGLLELDTFGSNFDTEIGLYDAVGNFLAGNDDAIGLQSALAEGQLPAGTYYLAAAGFDSTFHSAGWGVAAGSASGTLELNIEAPAETFYVSESNVRGVETGANWSEAFSSLQQALDLAYRGDEIWVAGGRYVPERRSDPGDSRSITFAVPEGVALYGGFAGTESTLGERSPSSAATLLGWDAGARGFLPYHVVTIEGADVSVTTVIDGVTIENGLADGLEPHDQGGGILNLAASLSLYDVVLSNNTAQALGGGVYSAGAITIGDSEFLGNDAGTGSGLFVKDASVYVYGSNFVFNESTNNGGALALDHGTGGAVFDSNFSLNRALGGGGAVRVEQADLLTIEGTSFFGNWTENGANGGAIYHDGAPAESGLRIINSEFVGNTAAGSGGALWTDAGAVITNSSIVENHAATVGGGIRSDSSGPALVVQNSILFGNQDGGTRGSSEAQISVGFTAPASDVRHTLIEGGHPGTGNLDLDPLFVSMPTSGDGSWLTLGDNDYGSLALQSGSPAIDAGDNTVDLAGPGQSQGPLTNLTDDIVDGPRFVDDPAADTGVGPAPVVDMGAHERSSIFADGFESGNTSSWSP